MSDAEPLQRTTSWWLARRGKITGSKIHRVLSGTKAKGWKTLASSLAMELRQDTMPESFRSAAMERGEEMEPATLANAALNYGFRPILVGFKQHPTIPYLGASSDFLVRLGRSRTKFINGEGKAFATLERHMAVVMNRQLPKEYKPQVQLQMAVHGADLTYFIAHHPEAPDWRMRTVKIEVERDQRYIDYMLEQCAAFMRFYSFTIEDGPARGVPETF